MAYQDTVKEWFRTGLKPTQAQFWAKFSFLRWKDEAVPVQDIAGLPEILNGKAEEAVLTNHLTDEQAHADLFYGKEDKVQKGAAGGYAPLNEFSKIASQYLKIIDDLITGGYDSLLSAEQGKVLQTQIDNINVLLASDNIDLDNVQELVDAIETIQISLSTILVNDLTTGGATKALTAEMGKSLKALIDIINKAINYKTPQQYGAVGDGITDDTQAIQNAVNTGFPVSLGGKNTSYLITSSIVIPDNGSIFGQGAVLETTLDISILILGKNCKVDGLVFTGDGKGTGKLNQIGVFIDGGVGYANVSNTNVSNCTFNNLSGSGYLVKRVVGNHEGNILSNSKFEGCKTGVNIEERGEYTIVNSCSVSLCDTGISIRGGNSLISSCVVTNNTLGIIVLNGDNDAHGTVANTFIKHNTTYGIKVEQISVEDFTFSNCQITYGDVWLYRCKGVVFDGCCFSGTSIFEQGCTNCHIINYRFIGDVANNPNFASEPSQVFYQTGILDQTFLPTSNRRLQGAYSHMFLNTNTIVPNGINYILNWQQIEYNSISKNVNYTLHNFWNSVNKCWDYDSLKTPSSEFLANIDVQLSVGAATGLSACPIEQIDIYLWDSSSNRRLATLTASPVLDGIYRIYSFNGAVPKSQIQIRINNNSGANIALYREQGGSVPAFGIATGF